MKKLLCLLAVLVTLCGLLMVELLAAPTDVDLDADDPPAKLAKDAPRTARPSGETTELQRIIRQGGGQSR
jgi:hypothetical protein